MACASLAHPCARLAQFRARGPRPITPRMTKLTQRLLAVLALTLALLPARSFAASHTWSGAVNGNFSTAGNWSAGGVPTLEIGRAHV